LAEAVRTVEQPGFNPSDYTFFGGTDEGPDSFNLKGTEGRPDVFCGFGGDDGVLTLEAGDIFLGGAGIERVDDNFGTFNGGSGDDSVRVNSVIGIFFGEEGNDRVDDNSPRGTFDGGPGDDSVVFNNGTVINVEQVG
jgi:Ca2+-binding RTX toxin-like protein